MPNCHSRGSSGRIALLAAIVCASSFAQTLPKQPPANATIFWQTGQDGDWSDSGNWDQSRVPDTPDVVVIDVPSIDITVTIGLELVTVTGWYSTDAVRFNNPISNIFQILDLAEVRGTFAVESPSFGNTIRADGDITFSGGISLDVPRVFLQAFSGAALRIESPEDSITFPAIFVLEATGTSTSIDLPTVTTIPGSVTDFAATASSGATVDLSSLTTLPENDATFIAMGTGSVLDITGVTQLVGSTTGETVLSPQGGDILTSPTLDSMENIRLSLSTGGGFTNLALRSFIQGRIDVSVLDVAFASLTETTNSDFSTDRGAVSLPLLTSLDGSRTLSATGSDGILDFSAVTQLNVANPSTTINVTEGGRVVLPALTQLTGTGELILIAAGSDSEIDLSSLDPSSSTVQITINESDGGVVLLGDGSEGEGEGEGEGELLTDGVISGVVTDENQDPLECATVRIYQVSPSAEFVRVSPIDVNGGYEIESVPLDLTGVSEVSYEIEVFAPGFVLDSPIEVVDDDFTVSAGVASLRLDIELTPSNSNPNTSVVGTVTDEEDGYGIAGALVEAFLNSIPFVPPLTTFTCGNGSFQINGLPAAKLADGITLNISAPNYDAEDVSVDETGRVDALLDKSFPFPNTVFGTVTVAEDDSPLEGAQILVQGTASALGLSLQTDEEGLYSIDLPEDGEYTVDASAAGFERARVSRTVSTTDPSVRADFSLDVTDGTEGEGEGEGEGGGCASTVIPSAANDWRLEFGVLLGLLGAFLRLAAKERSGRAFRVPSA